jgi:hypothetical protein
MPIAVTFEIPRHEAAAVEWGAMKIVGPRAHVLYSDSESGVYELELRIDDSSDLNAARAAGETIYRDIRSASALPEAASVPTGVFRYGESIEPISDFVDDAEDMFDQHRYELCVVAAQTVCEVIARTVVEEIAAGPRRLDFAVSPTGVKGWSLMQDATRLLFFAATGQRPWGEAWWGAYSAHVTRRNNVAHKGAKVTREEAAVEVPRLR